MPKPIISSEYGIEASARATPNSACTAGSTTGTMYMPHAPMVMSASVTIRRAAAVGSQLVRKAALLLRLVSSRGSVAIPVLLARRPVFVEATARLSPISRP